MSFLSDIWAFLLLLKGLFMIVSLLWIRLQIGNFIALVRSFLWLVDRNLLIVSFRVCSLTRLKLFFCLSGSLIWLSKFVISSFGVLILNGLKPRMAWK